jgi:hypothetical protein
MCQLMSSRACQVCVQPTWAAWGEAQLALSPSIWGTLGAQLLLVPVRRRWRAVVDVPGRGWWYLDEVRWRDPRLCVTAARTLVAAWVVADAPLLAQLSDTGITGTALDTLLRNLLSRIDQEAAEAPEAAPPATAPHSTAEPAAPPDPGETDAPDAVSTDERRRGGPTADADDPRAV